MRREDLLPSGRCQNGRIPFDSETPSPRRRSSLPIPDRPAVVMSTQITVHTLSLSHIGRDRAGFGADTVDGRLEPGSAWTSWMTPRRACDQCPRLTLRQNNIRRLGSKKYCRDGKADKDPRRNTHDGTLTEPVSWLSSRHRPRRRGRRVR
jgi:hypothetical protein